jgi:hypothetical protein
MSKDGSHFKHIVYAKLAGAEWVRTSVRASGSTMRAMRKAEGENALNSRMYNSPVRKRQKRDRVVDALKGTISMKTVVMTDKLLCVVCENPTPPMFLTHAANPYWNVCENCVKT